MKVIINPDRVLFKRDPMIYGQFLEHFHRQIYGGVYQPGSPLADEDGFRTDVLDALRKIRVPIIRWPGGCFVSSYHWEDGVGANRESDYNKAWRVEEPNTFGTDEFVAFCRKLGCEPYICTNAGTGTAEEMSNWMEYCNLAHEGKYAKRRIANGFSAPHKVKYWSIGNENYGRWEMGAKDADEWCRLVEESAKMMQRVDPSAELSAAALSDTDWNVKLLKTAGDRLKWISIHGYWDNIHQTNDLASYDRCMAYTAHLDDSIRRVRGLLAAFGLENRIRIAFDEWNLRGWYHPNVHTLSQASDLSDCIKARDDNDINSSYTMADAVFSACFLNTLLRNADVVGMANFAPVVNTRGAIFTHDEGIVLRTTYHVFDMYVNLMGDEVIDMYVEDPVDMPTTDGLEGPVSVPQVDCIATRCSATGTAVVACVNKHASAEEKVFVSVAGVRRAEMTSLVGDSTDDYNDIGRDHVHPEQNDGAVELCGEGLTVTLPPHSVNIIRLTL